MLDTTWVTPLKGPRGDTFTLTGDGYPEGTVTIFDGDNESVDPGEVLDTKIVSRGTFTSAPLRVRGSLSDLDYEVYTRDSKGDVRSFVYYINKPTMSFSPEPARVGDSVTIRIEDWQDSRTDKGVFAVYIAGEEAITCNVSTTKDANSDNVVSIENATVPVGTLPGMQMVQVYTKDQHGSDCSKDMTGVTPEVEKTIQIVPAGTPLDPQKTTEISRRTAALAEMRSALESLTIPRAR